MENSWTHKLEKLMMPYEEAEKCRKEAKEWGWKAKEERKRKDSKRKERVGCTRQGQIESGELLRLRTLGDQVLGIQDVRRRMEKMCPCCQYHQEKIERH